jgi:hypothetical protein
VQFPKRREPDAEGVDDAGAVGIESVAVVVATGPHTDQRRTQRGGIVQDVTGRRRGGLRRGGRCRLAVPAPFGALRSHHLVHRGEPHSGRIGYRIIGAWRPIGHSRSDLLAIGFDVLPQSVMLVPEAVL